jgi:Helix-turn-helix domain
METIKTSAVAPAGTTAQVTTLNRQDTTAPNQRAIILEALASGPKTTVQLRDNFNIMAPAVRIKELRELGHVILTRRVQVETSGVRHINVAQYVYVSEPRTLAVLVA